MTETDLAVVRLLVVADAWCQTDELADAIDSRSEHRAGEVLVVAPALTGRFHSLVSDIDGAVEEARTLLDEILAQLGDRGVRARGQIGDEDPIRAIEDALYSFPATRLLLVTAQGRQNWREHELAKRVAAFGLPVRNVTVSAVRSAVRSADARPVSSHHVGPFR